MLHILDAGIDAFLDAPAHCTCPRRVLHLECLRHRLAFSAVRLDHVRADLITPRVRFPLAVSAKKGRYQANAAEKKRRDGIAYAIDDAAAPRQRFGKVFPRLVESLTRKALG